MLDSSGCTVCARRLDGRPSLVIEAPLELTYPSTSSVTTQSLISAQGFHCSIGALHLCVYYSELHKCSGFSSFHRWPSPCVYYSELNKRSGFSFLLAGSNLPHAGHSLSGNRSFRDLKPMMSPEGIRTAGIPELTHCDMDCCSATRSLATS